MVLVDTSVWIEHFRKSKPGLAELLGDGSVLMHPFVIGELACGNLRNRSLILTDLSTLPLAKPATHEETLRLIGDRNLWGCSIGWIDAHLLASTLLSDCQVWTLDMQFSRAAFAVGLLRHSPL